MVEDLDLFLGNVVNVCAKPLGFLNSITECRVKACMHTNTCASNQRNRTGGISSCEIPLFHLAVRRTAGTNERAYQRRRVVSVLS